MVEAFIGTPMKPINPAVINKGSKLGTIETKIILSDLNINAINNAINKMAKDNDKIKLLIK